MTDQSLTSVDQTLASRRTSPASNVAYPIHIIPAFLWQTTTWLFGWCILKLFCSLRVSGREHLSNAPHGVILAANHASDIDGILLLAGIAPFSRHFPVYFVAKPSDAYTRTHFWDLAIYTPWFLTLVGAIAVNKGSRDYSNALKNHITIISSKHTVAIFPEGQVNTESEPFSTIHGGIAYLSEATQAPIMPVWISGTYDMSVRSFFSRKHIVTVTYGKPILPEQIFTDAITSPSRYKIAAERACDEILKLRPNQHVR